MEGALFFLFRGRLWNEAREKKSWALSAAFGDKFDNTAFHEDGIQTAMRDRHNDFVEEKCDQVLVAHITPKVDVQIMTVNL